MAAPRYLSVRDFTNSRYAQLADSSDMNMADVLASAEFVIEDRLGRTIGLTPYTEVIRDAKTNTFFMKHRPVASVTQVRKRFNSPNGAWTTVDPSYYYYETGPGYVETRYQDVRGFDVELTYTAGYTEIPAGLREAVLLQTVLLTVQDFETYGTGDSNEPGYVAYFNEDIDRFLARYDTTSTVYN